MEKDFFDLNDGLMVDTYLVVKYGIKFVHYNIPCIKANGEARTYGELYWFYTSKPNFKMAMGYVRKDDGEFWTAQKQYFYFDKIQMPNLVDRPALNSELCLKKGYVKSLKL